jgi:hypothetical protein
MRTIQRYLALCLAIPIAASANAAVAPAWMQIESDNFRVLFQANEPQARRLLHQCEARRDALTEKWLAKAPAKWSVRCDVVMHETAASYKSSSGVDPAFSAGFSDVVVDAGRVATRRIEVDGTDEKRMRGVVDHELTHVVIADAFGQRRLPRWADEGIAVLSEPTVKKQLRRNDLLPAVHQGEHIPFDELFQASDYPTKGLQLFYGQSASIVEYLVHLGGEARLVDFLKHSQTEGYLAALNRHYQVDSFEELENRWRRHESQRMAAADHGSLN